MKIHQDERIVLSNSTSEKRFTINATAKAFRILSDGLYSRKIEAIVRELSCNAFDSHVMAGIADVPFVIQLPDEWCPEFSVEDFGIGLDALDVEEIYTSYFTSTKTESNDVIGALGLGSKTPFSYTDAFNLRTRKDGIEYTYTAFINANGEPSVSLLAQSETTERNGVKVSVPVRPKDFSEFAQCAVRVYSYFRIKPDVVGRDLSYENVSFDLLEQNGYYLTKGQKNTVTALMGNVAYHVPYVSNLAISSFAASMMGSVHLVVEFQIGELDVAASRETISFDENTEKVFIARIEKIVERLIEDTQNVVNTLKSIQAAIVYVIETFGEWALPKFEFKGVNLDTVKNVRWPSFLQSQIKQIESSLFVPKPIKDARTGELRLKDDGTPEMTAYELVGKKLDHTYLGLKERRASSVTQLNLEYAGRSLKTLAETAKIIIFEGQPEGYLATAKELAKDIHSNPFKTFSGLMFAETEFSDDTKIHLLDMFGDCIEFVNAAECVELRKARRKAERDARRKEAQVHGEVAPRQPRIKKREVRASIYSPFLRSGRYLWPEFTPEAVEKMDMDDIEALDRYILVRGYSNDLLTEKSFGFSIEEARHMMHFTGIYNLVVVRAERDFELLKDRAVNLKQEVVSAKANPQNVMTPKMMALVALYGSRNLLTTFNEDVKPFLDGEDTKFNKLVESEIKTKPDDYSALVNLLEAIHLYGRDMGEREYKYSYLCHSIMHPDSVVLTAEMENEMERLFAWAKSCKTAIVCKNSIMQALYEKGEFYALDRYIEEFEELQLLREYRESMQIVCKA